MPEKIIMVPITRFLDMFSERIKWANIMAKTGCKLEYIAVWLFPIFLTEINHITREKERANAPE